MTPDLHKSIVPVAAAMIATEELSPNLLTHLLPNMRVYGCGSITTTNQPRQQTIVIRRAPG